MHEFRPGQEHAAPGLASQAAAGSVIRKDDSVCARAAFG